MSVQAIKNQNINNMYGNTRGGIKYLQITGKGSKLQFVEVPKEISDAGVFIAGGSEVDKKVREANIKIINKHADKTAVTNQKSGFVKLFERFFKK